MVRDGDQSEVGAEELGQSTRAQQPREPAAAAAAARGEEDGQHREQVAACLSDEEQPANTEGKGGR